MTWRERSRSNESKTSSAGLVSLRQNERIRKSAEELGRHHVDSDVGALRRQDRGNQKLIRIGMHQRTLSVGIGKRQGFANPPGVVLGDPCRSSWRGPSCVLFSDWRSRAEIRRAIVQPILTRQRGDRKVVRRPTKRRAGENRRTDRLPRSDLTPFVLRPPKGPIPSQPGTAPLEIRPVPAC